MRLHRACSVATGVLGLLLLSSWALAQNVAPQPAQNVQVTDIGGDNGTALRLSFSKSPDDGSGANDVKRYKIYKRLSGGTPTYLTPVTATGAVSYQMTITGLTRGVNYGIGVVAFDGALNSTAVVKWATPVDNKGPRPPTSVVVTDILGDLGTAVRLTFGKSPDDGAGANDVTRYKLFKRLAGKPATALNPIVATGAATYQVNITGLTPGVSWGIGVKAFDGIQGSEAVVRWITPVDNLSPAPPA